MRADTPPNCETGGVAEDRTCYEAYLATILRHSGAEIALAKLSELEAHSPTVKAACHGMAHKLGQEGYRHYGNIHEALAHGGFDCSSGYYHGVLELALQEVPDYQQAVITACNGIPGGDGAFLFHWCNHGLGHGLAAFREYDLAQAVIDCNLLPTDWRRDSCWGGVFMEAIDAKFSHGMGTIARLGAVNDDGSDFWPCLSVDEQYRPACFRISTARVLPKHASDFRYVASACESLPSAFYTHLCVESYGRDAGGEGLHTDLARVHTLCGYFTGGERDTCYSAVAETVVAHFADPRRADAICTAAGASKHACEAGRDRIGRSIAQGRS